MHSDKIAQAHAQRARQFMPFAALTGYYSLVREQERITEPKRTLPEEEQARIDALLSQVHKGSMITVTYYDKDAYLTRHGMVSVFTPEFHTLTLVKTPIAFRDILDIKIIQP